LQIQRLRSFTDQIQASIFSLVYKNRQNLSSSESEIDIIELNNTIQELTTRIENSCSKRKGSPADLSTPSYRIYLWLRFLNKDEKISAHIHTLSELLDEILQQKVKIKSDPNHLLIKMDFSGYLYRRQTQVNTTILQINETFISSPRHIKANLITAAFSRRSSKQIKAIKSFANSHEYQRTNRQIGGRPIANHVLCVGETVNLKHLFNTLNFEYFQGELPQPRLIWSSRRAVRRLGSYHPEINTIAINKKLDKKDTPHVLVEYVLFHEMLHQNIGIKTSNGRRYAHTSTFKSEEKKFKHYKEAENLIKNLQ
jgi:hypothetical protein